MRAVVDRLIDHYNYRPRSAPDLFGYTPLCAMEKFRVGSARMESDAAMENHPTVATVCQSSQQAAPDTAQLAGTPSGS